MWHCWAKVGEQIDKCVLANVGQRALWSIEKTWHSKFVGSKTRKLVARANGIVKRAWLESNKWHHVNNANSWVHARVSTDVEHVERFAREHSRWVGAGEGKHTAVVIGIAVQVEQVWSQCRNESSKLCWVSTLTDVDDAFQHPFCLSGCLEWLLPAVVYWAHGKHRWSRTHYWFDYCRFALWIAFAKACSQPRASNKRIQKGPSKCEQGRRSKERHSSFQQLISQHFYLQAGCVGQQSATLHGCINV